jgi:hypothetical protein
MLHMTRHKEQDKATEEDRQETPTAVAQERFDSLDFFLFGNFFIFLLLVQRGGGGGGGIWPQRASSLLGRGGRREWGRGRRERCWGWRAGGVCCIRGRILDGKSDGMELTRDEWVERMDCQCERKITTGALALWSGGWGDEEVGERKWASDWERVVSRATRGQYIAWEGKGQVLNDLEDPLALMSHLGDFTRDTVLSGRSWTGEIQSSTAEGGSSWKSLQKRFGVQKARQGSQWFGLTQRRGGGFGHQASGKWIVWIEFLEDRGGGNGEGKSFYILSGDGSRERIVRQSDLRERVVWRELLVMIKESPEVETGVRGAGQDRKGSRQWGGAIKREGCPDITPRDVREGEKGAKSG